MKDGVLGSAPEQRGRKMKNINFRRALLAGFAGTIVMSLIMMMAPLMGMPKMDVPGMLGRMLAGVPVAPGSAEWSVGLLMHLMIGTAMLSVAYAFVRGYLPTESPIAKGAIYGLLVWLISQVAVMPMMGAGLFSSNTPRGAAVAVGKRIGPLGFRTVPSILYKTGPPTPPTRRSSLPGLFSIRVGPAVSVHKP